MKLSLTIIIIILFSTIILYATDDGKMYHNKYDTEVYNNEIVKYNLKDGDTLLDIGCGGGDADAVIFQFYPNMFFVLEDIDSTSFKKNESFIYINGKKKYFRENALFVSGYIDSIPLPSESFSTILCRKTVHEFATPNRMLREIRRLLRTDGILIVEEAIPRKLGEVDPNCKLRYFSKQELVSLFYKNGFKLVSEDTTTMNIKKKNDQNMFILKFKKNIN